MQETISEKPLIFGIVIAAIIHSTAILIKELSPTPVLPSVIDVLAFNGSWIYIALVALFIALDARGVKDFFVCIPGKVTSRTIEAQKVVLGYEFTALTIILLVFPSITYFYAQVDLYVRSFYPDLHRFVDYMPFADLMNRAMTSFPFFVTLFAFASVLCVTIPHTYFAYKCAKKAPDPLQSAILFSILLSAAVTTVMLGLLALSVDPLLLVLLAITGPIILFSFIIVNVVMLRYHNRFIVCETPESAQ